MPRSMPFPTQPSLVNQTFFAQALIDWRLYSPADKRQREEGLVHETIPNQLINDKLLTCFFSDDLRIRTSLTSPVYYLAQSDASSTLI